MDCPKCNSTVHYYLSTLDAYLCVECQHQFQEVKRHNEQGTPSTNAIGRGEEE